MILSVLASFVHKPIRNSPKTSRSMKFFNFYPLSLWTRVCFIATFETAISSLRAFSPQMNGCHRQLRKRIYWFMRIHNDKFNEIMKDFIIAYIIQLV